MTEFLIYSISRWLAESLCVVVKTSRGHQTTKEEVRKKDGMRGIIVGNKRSPTDTDDTSRIAVLCYSVYRQCRSTSILAVR